MDRTATHSSAQKTYVEIADSAIDIEGLRTKVSAPNCGATVLFLGTTRRMTGTHETQTLYYECYREMALQEMARLAADAIQQWPLAQVGLSHRVGEVPIGEASVAIAVSSPHRAAAFEAASWLIDTLKQSVPIWKKDIAPDGTERWVDPWQNESGTS